MLARQTAMLRECSRLLVASTLAALSAALALGAQETPMTITTDRPGNLFVDGRQPVFEVRGAGTDVVRYEARDYWDNEVAHGEVKPEDGGAHISLEKLPHGYYELQCTAGEQKAMAAFAVIANHESAPLREDGRLAVDGATAWLSKPEQWQVIARMLRIAGIPWVRERLSWGQVEPKRNQLEWGKYDTVASDLAGQGIRVYQIFHDSPGWSHPGETRTRCPDDLRDVYRFAKTAGAHFKGRIEAWEVWNEPDIAFWPDLSDKFAGVQKAAYLGFHDSGADVPVLLASLCRGPSRFADALFESGIRDYFDIFNYHVYADPTRDYPRVAQNYLGIIDGFGCGGRPVWLTEAGIRLMAKDGRLTREDERRQAEFVPESFAMSLASGTDRHFFFVLPHYLENGVEFGSLRVDCTPYPGFVAVAAAVDLLGDAQYLGRYGADDAGFMAQVFDAGRENVMVIWAPEKQQVALPIGKPRVRVADLVGNVKTVATDDGNLALDVGPSPQYVLGLGEPVLAKLTGTVRPAGRLPRNESSRVVIVGHASVDTIDKDANCCLIAPEEFRFTVDVYNLAEEPAGEGTIRLRLPEGWSAEPSEVRVALRAMQREYARFTVRPAKAVAGLCSVVAEGHWDGTSVAPSVSDFKLDLSRAEPTASRDLGLDDPARWVLFISGNGKVEKRAGDGGGAAFDIRFTGAGDRWCYPQVNYDPPADFRGFDGISFLYRCSPVDRDTRVRLQLCEPNGAAYLTGSGVGAAESWRRAQFALADLAWGSFSPNDPDGKLDLDAISVLRIGCNTRKDELTLQVRDVKLVRF